MDCNVTCDFGNVYSSDNMLTGKGEDVGFRLIMKVDERSISKSIEAKRF